MDHAYQENGRDEFGNYVPFPDKIFIPNSPNVMSDANTMAYSKQPLQSYISSAINVQPANKSTKTLSIKAAFINRFGDATPNAKLPTIPIQ